MPATAGITLAIGARGRLVLDGLVFAGGTLTLPGAADDELRELVLRDCTLVPGLTLDPHGSPVSPGAVSLPFGHPFGKLTLLRCITGPLLVPPDVEVDDEGLHRRLPAAPAMSPSPPMPRALPAGR